MTFIQHVSTSASAHVIRASCFEGKREDKFLSYRRKERLYFQSTNLFINLQFTKLLTDKKIQVTEMKTSKKKIFIQNYMYH